MKMAIFVMAAGVTLYLTHAAWAEPGAGQPPVKVGSDVAEWIGDTLRPVAIGLPLTLYISGSDRDRTAARRAANAELLSNGLAEILKHLTKEPRPRDPTATDGFPSAHSATAWALATVLAHEYPEHDEILYGYALAMTWSRRGSRYHTWAQTLAGSLLGWGVARLELSDDDGLLFHVTKPSALTSSFLDGADTDALPTLDITLFYLRYSF
jgi:membrane-associated phospholipid phosphatase